MPRNIIDYFHFSRAERLGASALLIISALCFLLPELVAWMRPQRTADFSEFITLTTAFREAVERDSNNFSKGAYAGGGAPVRSFSFDPNTVTREELVLLGLSDKVAGTICHYREKGGKFFKPEDFQKIYSLRREDYERLKPYLRFEGRERSQHEFEGDEPSKTLAEQFPFDPNTASETDLKRLGLPVRIVSNLLKYRERGGKFRKADDLLKLYGFSEEDYARLAPYVQVAPAKGGEKVAPQFTHYEAASEKSSLVDINRAGLEDWMSLPGIGAGRARQILNFREKLGGFVSVDQIAETHGLPDSVFQAVRPLLQASTSGIRQIDLNTASADDLNAHPYFSYKQAQLILNYRAQHGPFASVADLSKIIPFKNPAWLEKVKPYLKTE